MLYQIAKEIRKRKILIALRHFGMKSITIFNKLYPNKFDESNLNILIYWLE